MELATAEWADWNNTTRLHGEMAPLRGNRPYRRYFLANRVSSTGTA